MYNYKRTSSRNLTRLYEAPVDSKAKSILSSQNKQKLIQWFQEFPPETGLGIWVKEEVTRTIDKKRAKNVAGAFFYKHESGRFKAWSLVLSDHGSAKNDKYRNTVHDDDMLENAAAVVNQLSHYWYLPDIIKQNGVGVFKSVRQWEQTVRKAAKSYLK